MASSKRLFNGTIVTTERAESGLDYNVGFLSEPMLFVHGSGANGIYIRGQRAAESTVKQPRKVVLAVTEFSRKTAQRQLLVVAAVDISDYVGNKVVASRFDLFGFLPFGNKPEHKVDVCSHYKLVRAPDRAVKL